MAERAEHTPGPWGLEGTTEFGYAIRGTAPSRPIADNVTTEANARLIAAAPGLLAALKWALPLLVAYFSPGGMTEAQRRHFADQVITAQAAIEAAEA